MQKIETVCPECLSVNRLDRARIADRPQCGRCHKPLMNGQPVNLDDRNFKKLIAREQLPVVVDFWASWCGPCKAMAPVFANTANVFVQQARFVKVDSDKAPAISAEYAIRSIPTLMIFKAGQVVAQTSGAMSEGAFKSWVESYL